MLKNQKLFPIILLVIIILIAIIAIMTTSIEKTSNTTDINDYTPEEEINNKNIRETVLTLYFISSEDNNLKTEGRLIDSNILLDDPYKTIIQCLLDGPKNTILTSPFPKNVQLLNATLENNCVTLNFSEEILNFEDDTQKYNIINCMLNTLTQLTEVNSIKILVNEQSIDGLNEEYARIH